MKTITLLAQKGGTGETILSIHLATAAANRRYSVLTVDIDPQGSSFFWSQRRQRGFPGVVKYSIRELRKNMATIAREVDLMILDTPSHSSRGAGDAVSLLDFVLIPSRLTIHDSVKLVCEKGKSGAIVLNCCPPPGLFDETALVREACLALEVYKMPVSPVAISQRAAFSLALIDGRAVTEFEKKGKAAGEIKTLWGWIKKELANGEQSSINVVAC